MISGSYSNNEYHKLDGISKSGLDMIAKSPAHFKAGYSGIDSDNARIGTALHSWVLEGRKDILLPPDIKRSSKADRASWAEWFAENGAEIDTSQPAGTWFGEFSDKTGKSIVTSEDFAQIQSMAESVQRNEQAARLFTGGKVEQSIITTYNGVVCRARPDYMHGGDNHILVDLKSTQSAAPWAFRQSCAKYRYHVQQAFYSQLYYEETGHYPEFYFVAVEKSAPYSCVVYKLDDVAVENGVYLMERDIETYKNCMASGIWPSYENDLSLSIPIYEEETFDIEIDGMAIAV